LKFKDRRANRRGVADQLRTLIRRARDLADGVDPETLNRRPAAGGWSAAQCIEHLNETARVYLPLIATAIEEGRATVPPAARGDGRTLLGRVIAWSQEPPVRFRTRTMAAIEPPSHELDPVRLMEDFEALHEELIVRVNESAAIDRKKVRLRSALDSRLTLSLGDWFAFLAAHGRRHLWQADQVLQSAREPGSD
jgi:hypothetical protein